MCERVTLPIKWRKVTGYASFLELLGCRESCLRRRSLRLKTWRNNSPSDCSTFLGDLFKQRSLNLFNRKVIDFSTLSVMSLTPKNRGCKPYLVLFWIISCPKVPKNWRKVRFGKWVFSKNFLKNLWSSYDSLWELTPIYDAKLTRLHWLKRPIFVVKKPTYGSQTCHFIGKVTKFTNGIGSERLT